ncbi:MAG: hypothetical protein Tp158DCM1229571_73 [Prokaryotic dsDNA virus sp.]|nr:MAG: hypothetical protein Tp158DCM1229571_73 [Prokaryotic dsDNA virus sp.]
MGKPRKYIERNRKNFLELKKKLKCNHCGYSDYRAIDFHHTQGDKEANISTMVRYGYAWSRIEDELNKCIPLCCNCHRIEHELYVK